MTDLPDVVPQLERTAELNKAAWSSAGGNLRTAALNWGLERTALLELVKPPDILLLSDCVYYEEVNVLYLAFGNYFIIYITELYHWLNRFNKSYENYVILKRIIVESP